MLTKHCSRYMFNKMNKLNSLHLNIVVIMIKLRNLYFLDNISTQLFIEHFCRDLFIVKNFTFALLSILLQHLSAFQHYKKKT